MKLKQNLKIVKVKVKVSRREVGMDPSKVMAFSGNKFRTSNIVLICDVMFRHFSVLEHVCVNLYF